MRVFQSSQTCLYHTSLLICNQLIFTNSLLDNLLPLVEISIAYLQEFAYFMILFQNKILIFCLHCSNHYMIYRLKLQIKLNISYNKHHNCLLIYQYTKIFFRKKILILQLWILLNLQLKMNYILELSNQCLKEIIMQFSL